MTLSIRHAKQGFSLVEMLVVIFIIGIIAGVIGRAVYGGRQKGRQLQAEGELRAFKNAIESYDMDIGDYPDRLEDLITPPADERANKWREGGYMDKKRFPKQDPWKNKYFYQLTPDAEEHPFELYSYGPKGKKAKRNEYIDAWDL